METQQERNIVNDSIGPPSAGLLFAIATERQVMGSPFYPAELTASSITPTNRSTTAGLPNTAEYKRP